MNYPRPENIKTKPVQLPKYLAVPGYGKLLLKTVVVKPKPSNLKNKYFREAAELANERFSGILGFDDGSVLPDIHGRHSFFQDHRSTNANFAGQAFTIRCKNNSNIESPCTLFCAADNSLSSNFGNPSHVDVRGNTLSYSDILQATMNQTLYIAKMHVELVVPANGIFPKIKYLALNGFGAKDVTDMKLQSGHNSLLASANFRDVSISVFDGLLLYLQPNQEIEITIVTEP